MKRLEGLKKAKPDTVSDREIEKAQAAVGSLTATIDAAKEDVKYYELQRSYSKIAAAITGTIGKVNVGEGYH